MNKKLFCERGRKRGWKNLRKRQQKAKRSEASRNSYLYRVQRANKAFLSFPAAFQSSFVVDITRHSRRISLGFFSPASCLLLASFFRRSNTVPPANLLWKHVCELLHLCRWCLMSFSTKLLLPCGKTFSFPVLVPNCFQSREWAEWRSRLAFISSTQRHNSRNG